MWLMLFLPEPHLPPTHTQIFLCIPASSLQLSLCPLWHNIYADIPPEGPWAHLCALVREDFRPPQCQPFRMGTTLYLIFTP